MNPTPATAPAQTNADPSQFGNYSDWAKGEMAKGFTPEQLQQHLTQSGVKVDQPHSGNWFTHLLPTIGSVAAPVIGALLAPETMGGSLIAAAALSGAGAAAGKAGENAAEGKSVINKSDLTAGLEGAAGGAAGGVAGKVLGKGASMLGNTADNLATKQAAQTAAQDGIDTAANTYKDVSPQLQKAYNAKDSLAHVTKMGYDIADPANLEHVSNTSGDVLNDTINKVLTNSGPVDLSRYPQIIKDALAEKGNTLGSFEKIALARGRLTTANTPAAKLLQQLEDLGAGVAKSNSDPSELRTLTTKLGEMAADAKPTVTAATGAVDPQQRAIYDVINNVRGQVKDALYKRPEVMNAVKGETGGLVADPKMNITQELADHLNGVIGGATKPQDLLDELSKNINIGKLGAEGQKVGNIVTSTGAKARAATEAGLDTTGTPPTGNTMMDMAGLINPHAGAISGVVGAAKHVTKNPAILSTLSRIGAMGAKLAPAAGAVVGTSPNLAASPTGPGVGYGEGGTNGTMGGTMNGSAMGEDPNSVNSILRTYMGMGATDPYLLGQTSGVVQALAPVAQKQQLVGSELGALPSSFSNAGGAQGLGGILSHISGLIPGTAAHAYQGQQAAAAQALAQQLGITPQAAAALLPQLMQNSNTAGINSGILSTMQHQLAY